jgi:hypothetical protein
MILQSRGGYGFHLGNGEEALTVGKGSEFRAIKWHTRLHTFAGDGNHEIFENCYMMTGLVYLY